METSQLSQLFKALGDSNRLTILKRLSCGEECGCTLIDRLDITQPTLSHHLKTLEESGLTTTRKEGVWKKHTIDDNLIDNLIAFLETLKSKGVQD